MTTRLAVADPPPGPRTKWLPCEDCDGAGDVLAWEWVRGFGRMRQVEVKRACKTCRGEGQREFCLGCDEWVDECMAWQEPGLESEGCAAIGRPREKAIRPAG